ncbi:hypothetical protein POTOM_002770 [Populus tomentosa]|uniref:Uncharacterized protein n=1 Tax=Populus tomentosa TaxID=118781 RepID=A0A8X8DKC0_POPTO|nr:hypothetical protein POTOM_002770 [Populus tomentosa]
MQLVRIIFIIAMTVALSTTLTVKRIGEDGEKPPKDDRRIDTSTRLSEGVTIMHDGKELLPSKRLSRFLAEEKNPRAADHCNKDNEICHILQEESVCCSLLIRGTAGSAITGARKVNFAYMECAITHEMVLG